jgi:hypothetical protein
MDATPLLYIDKENSLMIILYCLLTTLSTNKIPLNKQRKFGYFIANDFEVQPIFVVAMPPHILNLAIDSAVVF